jgi:ribosomal protein S6--L-glutamate ligase
MKLVTFDALRTLEIPGARYIKPELVWRHRDAILEADWVLYPQDWQVNFLTYAWQKRIFPSGATYHLGRDKVEQTRAVMAVAPEAIPETLILPNDARGREEVLDTFPFPFVAKLPRASMGRGVFLIENREEFERYCERTDVLYVQERLPIDRDLRVVWVGDRILGWYWRVGPEGGFHNNVARGGAIEHADAPPRALELVREVATRLGIDHAGFDIALVDGQPYFLEFNVKFGNTGLHQLGIQVGPAILEYLESQSSPEPVRPSGPERPLPRAS